MSVRSQYIAVQGILRDAYAALGKLQAECSHIGAKGVFTAAYGNYPRQNSKHILDVRCPDCGKQWAIDEGAPEYKTFPRSNILKEHPKP